MGSETPNPFEVLGIGLEADDAEVRRAYATKLREARRGGDKDRESEVQQAFEALRDDDSRQGARAWVEKGDEVRRLMDVAIKDIDEGQIEAAADTLRRVLELFPGFVPAISWLVRIEVDRGRHDAAIAVLEPIVEARPESWQERAMLASVLYGKACSLGLGGASILILERALELVRQAKTLGHEGLSSVLDEVRILVALSKFREAEELLLKALQSPGGARDDGWKLLLTFLEVQGAAGYLSKFSATLSRIESDMVKEKEDFEPVLKSLLGLCLRIPATAGDFKIRCARCIARLHPVKEEGGKLVQHVVEECEAVEKQRTTLTAAVVRDPGSSGGCSNYFWAVLAVTIIGNLVRSCANMH